MPVAAQKPEPKRHWRVKLTAEQGEAVRAARVQAGLTIYDIQRLVAVDYTAMHRFEKGERAVPIEQLVCICRMIGLDYESLGVRDSQLTLMGWKLITPERRARGGEWKQLQSVYTQRAGAEVRPHKFWEQFSNPDLTIYRADLLCQALMAKRKQMRVIYAESSVGRVAMMSVLAGKDAHISLIKQVALYAGVPFDALFSTESADSKAA